MSAALVDIRWIRKPAVIGNAMNTLRHIVVLPVGSTSSIFELPISDFQNRNVSRGTRDW